MIRNLNDHEKRIRELEAIIASFRSTFQEHDERLALLEAEQLDEVE